MYVLLSMWLNATDIYINICMGFVYTGVYVYDQ